LFHDDASAQKAHTRNYIGDDLRSAGVSVQMHSNVHEGRSSHCYEYMCSQATAALPVLSLCPDKSAKYECG